MYSPTTSSIGSSTDSPMALNSFLDKRLLNSPTNFTNVRDSINSIDNDHSEEYVPMNAESLINWSSFNHVYSIISAYGGPSCILPTNSYFVLGTLKGALLIFNYKEFLQVILLPQCKGKNGGTDSNSKDPVPIRSQVLDIVMSFDGTHLAASYESGDVFIWNLNNNKNNTNSTSNPSSSSNNNNENVDPISAILHITEHQNKQICGIDFISERHTGLVVSDATGNISYHNGHRTGFWNMTYSSKNLLSLSTNEIVFNSNLNMDNNYLAILTNNKFGIISIDSKNNQSIIFDDTLNINNLTNINTIPQNSISWNQHVFYADTVAYSIKNKVTVYYSVGQRNKTKLTWKYTEPILSLQWVSAELLGVLTISHQFLLVMPQREFKTVMNIDLLIHDLLIPPHKHFKWYRNKLFLLTNYSFKVGKFVSWSSLTLKKVQKGNYIEALQLLNQFAQDSFPIPTLLSLSTNLNKRKIQLKEPFNNLTFAALKFLLNNNKIEYIEKLIKMAIQLQSKWFPDDNEKVIFQFLEVIWETILQQQEISVDNSSNDELQEIFLGTIRDLIESKFINLLPPVLFQSLLKRFPESLNKFVLNLHVQSWDHDMLVHECQRQKQYPLLIYIWNVSFKDYLTPLVDGLRWIRDGKLEKSEIYGSISEGDKKGIESGPSFIFTYLSFIFNDKQYPCNIPIIDQAHLDLTKLRLSYILFSGVDIMWPLESKNKLISTKDGKNEPAFPYLSLLLNFNIVTTLTMLNEVFEESFFNDDEEEDDGNDTIILNTKTPKVPCTLKINRQYIIDVLIDMLKKESKKSNVKNVYISVFISIHIVKYPQYIHVPDADIALIIKNICDSTDKSEEIARESENAVLALLPIFEPSDYAKFALQLRERGFHAALFSFYKNHEQYPEIISMYFADENLENKTNTPFSSIISTIEKNVDKNSVNFLKIKDIIEENFEKVIHLTSFKKAVSLFQKFDPSIHSNIKSSNLSEEGKLLYLEELFETYGLSSSIKEGQELKDLYVELSCKHLEGTTLLDWINRLDFENIDLDKLTDFLVKVKNTEALACVYYKKQAYVKVIESIETCIRDWFDSKASIDDLNRFIEIGINTTALAKQNKKECWIKLITCLMKEYSAKKNDSRALETCKVVLQSLFVKLTMSEAGNEKELMEILTGTLEHQDIILTRVQNVKGLFKEIFVNYHLEEAVAQVVLKIVQDSSLNVVDLYEKGLNQGWFIHYSECEICGRKLWGVGIDPDVFLRWEESRQNQNISKSPSSKDDDGKQLVIFCCTHGYHNKCLENMGQTKGKFSCLLCKSESNNTD